MNDERIIKSKAFHRLNQFLYDYALAQRPFLSKAAVPKIVQQIQQISGCSKKVAENLVNDRIEANQIFVEGMNVRDKDVYSPETLAMLKKEGGLYGGNSDAREGGNDKKAGGKPARTVPRGKKR